MLRGIEELEVELDAGGNGGNTGFLAMHDSCHGRVIWNQQYLYP